MDRHPTTTANADSSASKLLPAACLLALAAAVFFWLLLRNHGLGPAVFADEWYYSKMSRLQPLSEAIVPSYLYLWLLRATSSCGDGFLDCARIVNEFCLVAASPFIYAIARRVASWPLALLVAALALLAPFNLYTAFFMPEAMYYFGFAVLSWVALAWPAVADSRADDGGGRRRRIGQGLAAGVVLGLMSLVKVHALFLLPSLCLYLVGAGWLAARTRWLVDGVSSAMLAAATTLALKFGLGWLLAGDEALSVFGSFYSATASQHARRPLGELLQAAWTSGAGHLMAIAVLLALPLALLLQAVVSRRARAQGGAARRQLWLYALLMLGAAGGVAVMFTASISDVAPAEVLRLHLRYYSFVFPLLLAVAAGAIGAPAAEARAAHTQPRPRAWPLALLLAIVVLLGAWKLPGYSLNAVDGPEIHAIALDQTAGRILAGIELLVLLLWARGSRLAAPLFLLVAVPWMTVQGVLDTSGYLKGIDPHWQSDLAGKFAHRYVPAQEHNAITVVGNDVVQVMRAQFYIDAPDTGMLALPPDAPLEPYQMPLRNKWLLVIGHHPLPPGYQPLVATNDYTLTRMDTRRHAVGLTRFKEPLHPGGLVDAAEGLSHLEDWGRWSEGKRIVLHFSRPLPRRATVVIKAQAYGPNTGLPFTMHVGSATQSFRVTDLPQDITLHFATDGSVRSLAIDIPQPTAPHDVSPSIDTRKLGLGLTDIEISEPGG
jgi:phosphoglycerol transferase